MSTVKRDQDRFKILLMGAVDGELTAEERKEFELLLAENPEYKKEYQEYKNLKEATKEMKFKNPPAELWDSYWLSVYNRIERGLGWILLSIGCIILLTFAGFHFFKTLIFEADLPLIIKISIFSVIAGLAILLVSIVRERLFTYKSDPYKEIKR
ncbi:hypothetical protein JXQ31_17685 [candidate division KSB1 bacterium]|nr:hypothetical protein [candidate division KSB1 bacterium]